MTKTSEKKPKSDQPCPVCRNVIQIPLEKITKIECPQCRSKLSRYGSRFYLDTLVEGKEKQRSNFGFLAPILGGFLAWTLTPEVRGPEFLAIFAAAGIFLAICNHSLVAKHGSYAYFWPFLTVFAIAGTRTFLGLRAGMQNFELLAIEATLFGVLSYPTASQSNGGDGGFFSGSSCSSGCSSSCGGGCGGGCGGCSS